jgi:site-specific DNA recombinase
MVSRLHFPLVPRSSETPRVLALCRISSIHQDERSLASQLTKLTQSVAGQHNGRVKWSVISDRGSGESQARSESSAPSLPPAGRTER